MRVNMRGSLLADALRVMEPISGIMGLYTRVAGLQIKKKDLACINGLMVQSILVIGKMISLMALVTSLKAMEMDSSVFSKITDLTDKNPQESKKEELKIRLHGEKMNMKNGLTSDK